MKKMKLLLSVTVGALIACSSALMAGEQTLNDDYCTLGKTSTIIKKVSKVVAVTGDCKTLPVTHAKMLLAEQRGDILLYAEQTGNNYSPMLLANLNRKSTILLASIGGSGGAPMSKTGVSADLTI